MKTRLVVMAAMTVSAVLLVVTIFAGPSIFAGQSDNATYVGASKCKKCHIKLYKDWEKQPHAATFEILTAMGQEKNAECVKCHSTGFGTASGFMDIATTPTLAGTTCEACHGPGSEHIVVDTKDTETAKATITKATNACTQCHHPHERRPEGMTKEALPVLKKKLEELQSLIATLEAQ